MSHQYTDVPLHSNFAGVPLSIGALNPDLYKSPLISEEDDTEFPDGHLGRVWFGLKYDDEQEKLHISLVRIRNLSSYDKDSTNACDPLVRFVITTLHNHFKELLTKRYLHPNV